MSQAGMNNTSSGPTPPSVATSYVTDVNSPAVPIANVLDILGNYTNANNDNGIYTDGSSGSNIVTVFLSNRIAGKVDTSDNFQATIVDFTLPTTGHYTFDLNISAYNLTDTTGGAWSLFFGALSIAGTSSIENLPDQIVNASPVNGAIPAMTGCLVLITTTGNRVLVRVQGLATKSIHWTCVGTYVLAS